MCRLLAEGYPHFLKDTAFLGSWLPSHIFKTSNYQALTLHSSKILPFSAKASLRLCLPLLSVCDGIDPIQVIQDNIPIWKSATLIPSAKSILPFNKSHWEIWGSRVWTTLGDHYSSFSVSSMLPLFWKNTAINLVM